MTGRPHPSRKLVRDIRRMASKADRNSGVPFHLRPLPPRQRPVDPAPVPAPAEPVIVRTIREDRRLRAMHWIDCAVRLFPLGLALGLLIGGVRW